MTFFFFIFAPDKTTLTENTRKVLWWLQDNDLFLKPTKCEFYKMKVEYLGMIIKEGKISMDPGKLKGIQDWPIPTMVKQTRGFLGFGNLYQRFIQGFSNLAKPLNSLLKDKKFEWTSNCQKAFNELKKQFTEEPVLMIPDQAKPFQIEMDASKYATHSIRLKWQLTPHLIHFKDLLSDGTQLQDIWQRTIGNHLCLDGMATLHPRLFTYDDGSFRPQRLDLLLQSSEAELTTSKVVPIPIRIWYQTCPYTWTQNDPVRCPIPMTRSLPWWRHWQWGYHCVTWWSFHLPDWWQPSTMHRKLHGLWWDHDRSTQNPSWCGTYNYNKRTQQLDNGQIEWPNCPLLPGMKLHSTRH